MFWEDITLEREWDTRWDKDNAEDAILRAEEQVREAHQNVKNALACVQRAADQYASALLWSSSIRGFASKFNPEIPEPPEPA